MRQIIAKHKLHWGHNPFTISVITGLLFLIASLVVNHFTLLYATEHQSNYVTDLILSNVPIVDVDDIVAYGPLVLVAFISIFCIKEPRRIPFLLKSSSLFILVRAIFITFTHIGPFPQHSAVLNNAFVRLVSLGNTADLFFSGHTGYPFLMALIFWDHTRLRMTLILTSIFFACVMLLGHLHYSIDVFSAFFITYGIFVISKKFFLKDYEIFHKGLKIKTDKKLA